MEDLRQSTELAKTTYERQDNLWKQGIGSEMQYLQAKNQYVSLQKKLAAMEAQLDKLELVAPIVVDWTRFTSMWVSSLLQQCQPFVCQFK